MTNNQNVRIPPVTSLKNGDRVILLTDRVRKFRYRETVRQAFVLNNCTS